jgi:hypothetical protein
MKFMVAMKRIESLFFRCWHTRAPALLMPLV